MMERTSSCCDKDEKNMRDPLSYAYHFLEQVFTANGGTQISNLNKCGSTRSIHFAKGMGGPHNSANTKRYICSGSRNLVINSMAIITYYKSLRRLRFGDFDHGWNSKWVQFPFCA